MIRTAWPTLAIMLLAAGIFPALEHRFGWRFFSVLPIAYRPARFAAYIGGVAATPLLATSYSRNLVPVDILLTLLGYLLGTGFALLVATVLLTLASV
jgi:uncharacterized membrane protein